MHLSHTTTRNLFSRLRENFAPLIPAALLTLSYLLFDYHIQAAVFISPTKLVRPLIVMWVLLAPVYFFLQRITGDKEWSSLYLFMFVVVMYASSEYFEIVLTLVIILATTWTAIFYILRKKIVNLRQLNLVATATPAFLLIATLTRVIPIYLEPDWKAYLNDIDELDAPLTEGSILSENSPDIYYLVLDGYGRADVLQDYYDYDNSDFIQRLKDRGFIVPSESQSNYAKTVASVASTLNMNYLPEFTQGMEESLFWWQAKPYIEHNAAQSFLKNRGYTTISIATDWDITNNKKTDVYFKPLPMQLTEHEGNLIEKSRLNFLGPLISKVAFYPTNASHRELVLYNFRTITESLSIRGPKFVFAHIVSPHPPFVFDGEGTPISPRYGFTFNDANNFPGTLDEYKTEYAGQVENVNRLLEETIDTILSQSTVPPIIILQADHGPGMLTDFTSSENTCLRDRFSTFAAYYLPDAENNLVAEDTTPVNIFRIVLNEYFAANLPMLENRSYYFKDTVYIFRTEDVTTKLTDSASSQACNRPIENTP